MDDVITARDVQGAGHVMVCSYEYPGDRSCDVTTSVQETVHVT